ncbi:MAG: TIGR04372 family glycosyltransferase [Candidatus Protistobacter heckmanni]|nr:TIGR04372 family glycosyltransferase [Candidatus Protistobacter heckmanni]
MSRQALQKLGIVVTHLLKGNWAYVKPAAVKAWLKFQTCLFLPLGLLFVLAMRAARPLVLIRIGMLVSERLGHFAGNTELYLCEKDAGINTPKVSHVDIWYHNWPVSNRQLAKMWARVMHIWPAWLMAPTAKVNGWIPGGRAHVIAGTTCNDRDVHNLLDISAPHLSFLPAEEARGQEGLRAIGIPQGAPFVCLNVRDDSYLRNALPWWNWSYHDYRNCDIQNYVLAAEELTKRGYYVVRMGAAVNEAMRISDPNPMVIDYAAKGLRSDFMDIYLGAHCAFCISNGTGFDAVPFIFRRPIVYVDHVPVGIIATFSPKFLATTKKLRLRKEGRLMTFQEIFASGAGHGMSSREDGLGIDVDLIESTPQEVAAVVLEMEARQRGTWQTTDEDEALQRRFWEIFPRNALHGEIRSRFGAEFLRQNKALLN